MWKQIWNSKIVGVFFVFACLLAPCASASSNTVSPEGKHLLRELLSAGDYNSETDLDRAALFIEEEMESLLGKVTKGSASPKKARRLHRLLHKKWLLNYDSEADGLEQAVREGTFNCLSGTLLYALAAHELGFDVRIVESPGHLFLELHTSRRKIFIESTVSYCFDVPLQRIVGSNSTEDVSRWLRQEPLGVRPAEDHAGIWRMDLDEAIGFAWLNRAWSLLEQNDTKGSALAVQKAYRYLPDFTPVSKGVDRLLTKAFHKAYERGSFEDAFIAAQMAHKLYPQSTSVRDRLFASAAKLIFKHLARGNHKAALEQFSWVQEATKAEAPIGLSAFERSMIPELIRSLVLKAEFIEAYQLFEHYKAVELDPFEVNRLKVWLDQRSHIWFLTQL